MSDFDEVEKPKHYNILGEKDENGRSIYEPIKVIEDWGFGEGFCLGNAIKYILRAPHKCSEKTDLEKALWYLERAGDGDKHPYFDAMDSKLGPMAVAQAWRLPGRFQRALEHIFEGKYHLAIDEIKKKLHELDIHE